MTFPETYQQWRPAFEEALDARYYPIAWLDYVVMEGRAIFLATDDAAVVIEVRYFPTGAKDLHVICGAGALDELRGEILRLMVNAAHDNGCLAVAVESREGWARALKDLGFSTYKTVLRREL